MTKTSKTILFFGNERLATGVSTTAPTLQALIAEGYEVAAVIVAQAKTTGSRRTRELEIATVAKQHSIPLLAPASLKNAKVELVDCEAMAAVLVAYGKHVPSDIIDLFPCGIINIHPSLLPQHRGPTPIESTILGGDQRTGVSLMRLSPKTDTGPVYDQTVLELRGDETKQALADQLLDLGSKLLVQHLPEILDDSLQPLAQAESAASHDTLIHKTDGMIDWQKPAERLEREIRAYAGWPRSRTTLGNIDAIITEARVIKNTTETALTAGKIHFEHKKLLVETGQNLLEITRLVPAGKKEMSAEAFLAGHLLN